MSITATGVKGFLLWLKSDQPGIYQKVAPTLPNLVPGAFSKINKQTMGKLRAIYAGNFKSRASQALGQYGSYLCAVSPITYESFSPTVNYTACLTAPMYSASAICPGPAPTLSCTVASVNSSTDVASAANSGVSTPAITGAIGSAVNAVAQTLLSAQQAAALATIVASQLKNAQAGTAPADVSSGNLGVPKTTATTSSSSSTLLLLGLAGLAAWAALS